MEVKRNYIETESKQVLLRKNDPKLEETIKTILEREFGLQCEVEIQGYDLRHLHRITSFNYDQLLIKTDPTYMDKLPRSLERFKEFRIKSISYKFDSDAISKTFIL
jgi:hypothetical protein